MIADLAWGKNKCGVDSLVVLVSTAFTINYAPVTNALHKILRVRFKILAILCTVDQSRVHRLPPCSGTGVGNSRSVGHGEPIPTDESEV